MFSYVVASEDISVRASVDSNQISLNDQVTLSIETTGTQQVDPPQVDVEGFNAQYLGPATQISIINGQASSSITHNYILTPKKEGAWTIGPIVVSAGGRTFNTQPITVEVTAGGQAMRRAPSAPQSAGQAEDQAPTALGDSLQLQLGIDRTRAYVNQAVPARIQFLVGAVAVRGVEMPSLKADGFLVKPMKQPTQSQVMVGNQPYTLLQFDTEVVPIKSGALTLGPASIACQVAQQRRVRRRRQSPFGRDPFDELLDNSLFEDFFGQAAVRQVTVTAEPITINVMPLPEEGKPADFHGAVGAFTMAVEANPTELSAGEPVTVTTRIRGEGNQESIAPPVIKADPAQFKRYDPQQRSQPQAQGATQEKVFEQVLIPLNPSVKEIPPVAFSYFDPIREKYETLSQGPIPLAVKAAAAEPRPKVIERSALAAPSPSEPEVLGRDLVFIKEDLGALYPAGWRWHHLAGLTVLLLPFLLFAAGEALRHDRNRMLADPSLARASGALKKALGFCAAARRRFQQNQITESYAELFRAIQNYAGDRWNLPSEGLTRFEVERAARSQSVPEDVVRNLLECVDRCDAARFAPSSVASEQLAATIELTETTLKQCERGKA